MKINEIQINKSSIMELLKKYFYDPIFKLSIDDNGYVSVPTTVVLRTEFRVSKLPVKFLRVEGDFLCCDNNLTSIEGSPNYVGHMFNCARNQITSLEGGPEQVVGTFYCNENNLTNLIGAPRSVKNFVCHNNNLTSLEGLPKHITGTVRLSYSPQLPLMRLLVSPKIEFINPSVISGAILDILDKYAGQGKSSMMKCASELLTLGKHQGIDLRQNARW